MAFSKRMHVNSLPSDISSQLPCIFSFLLNVHWTDTPIWRADGHCYCSGKRRPRAPCKASVCPSQRRRCRKSAARLLTEISTPRSLTELARSWPGEEPHFLSTEIIVTWYSWLKGKYWSPQKARRKSWFWSTDYYFPFAFSFRLHLCLKKREICWEFFWIITW